jgi:hypothetical protein
LLHRLVVDVSVGDDLAAPAVGVAENDLNRLLVVRYFLLREIADENRLSSHVFSPSQWRARAAYTGPKRVVLWSPTNGARFAEYGLPVPVDAALIAKAEGLAGCRRAQERKRPLTGRHHARADPSSVVRGVSYSDTRNHCALEITAPET